MYYWSKNRNGNRIEIKDVAMVLEKHDEPPFFLEIISKSGKQTWEYDTKEMRDGEAAELRKLRDEYQEQNK